MHRTSNSLRRLRHACQFETLETRALFSVVSVTPQSNWIATINSSKPGDTISFGAGTYNVGGTSSNPTVLPADRHYVGNGATFGGTGHNIVEIDKGSATEVTDFTFSGVELLSNNAGGLNIHGNTFQNQSGDAVFLAGNSNGHTDHNTFNNVGGNGIYAYPGTNDTYDYNKMNNVGEGIHLSMTNGDKTDVSYNLITNSRRHGVEIQEFINGLTVTHNWVQAADMAFSIACGAKGTSPFAQAGQNITISNNVADGRGVTKFGAGIEIMGDNNINIDNNYIVGYPNGWGILNGTGGQRGGGLTTSGNTISAGIIYGDGDNTPWAVPPRHSNDTIYKYGDPKTPGLPAQPTNTGASADGTTPAPSNVSAPAVTAPPSGADTSAAGGTYVAATHASSPTLAGTSQAVKGATAAETNPSDAITLSVWVNDDNFDTARKIFQKGTGDGQYRLNITTNGQLRFDLNGVGTLTATPPATDSWHLITGTFDGTTMCLFVDGTLVASSAATGQISTTTGALSVGGTTVTDRTAAPGAGQLLVDDARIYSNALGASDIANLFTSAS